MKRPTLLAVALIGILCSSCSAVQELFSQRNELYQDGELVLLSMRHSHIDGLTEEANSLVRVGSSERLEFHNLKRGDFVYFTHRKFFEPRSMVHGWDVYEIAKVPPGVGMFLRAVPEGASLESTKGQVITVLGDTGLVPGAQ